MSKLPFSRNNCESDTHEGFIFAPEITVNLVCSIMVQLRHILDGIFSAGDEKMRFPWQQLLSTP